MVKLEDKIKQLCRVNNVTQKQLYAAIGVTDAGMRKMYARNSCEVTLLEKVASFDWYHFVLVASYVGNHRGIA